MYDNTNSLNQKIQKKMKKLKGMKGNFSSLENKKLSNLKFIKGGESNRSAPSFAVGADCSDTDYYTDDSSGNWTYKSRLTVCGPYSEGIAPQ